MGQYREIVINYGKLDEMIQRMNAYLLSLDRIEQTIDKNSELLSDQKGEAFTALEERRADIKELIAEKRAMALDLKQSFSRYHDEMENLIHPMERYYDVRIRRDDIWWNLSNIHSAIENVFSWLPDLPQQTDPYTSWYSDGKGGGHSVIDHERIDREVRNGIKIDEFRDYTLSRLKSVLYGNWEEMYDIYEGKVVAFENMDDEHAHRVKALYDQYTDRDERSEDRKEAFKSGVTSVGLGARDALVGTVKGLGSLGKAGAAGLIMLFAPRSAKLPGWVSSSLDSFKSGFKSMVSDPVSFFESIGQSFSDTYEREGLAYVCGGAAFEVGTFAIAPAKLAKIAKVSKGADVLDTAGDIGKTTSRIDVSDLKYKINRYDTAEAVNEWWANNGFDKPPYTPKTSILDITLEKETTFARVYDGEVSSLKGGWVMRAEDIKDLSPEQIQEKFALPTTPKYVGEVKIDIGTSIRMGEAGPNFGFGGGGVQFDLKGQYIGEFRELGSLSDWSLEKWN